MLELLQPSSGVVTQQKILVSSVASTCMNVLEILRLKSLSLFWSWGTWLLVEVVTGLIPQE